MSPRVPPLTPSKLEAWDRCPAEYAFTYLPSRRVVVPNTFKRPLIVGVAGHAILERYIARCVEARVPAQRELLPSIARQLAAEAMTSQAGRWGQAPDAPSTVYREALRLLTPFLDRLEVPINEIVGIERPMALGRDGTVVGWDEAWVRGKLDLLRISQRGGQRAALIQDWKLGWVTESEEALLDGYAPGLYGAYVWAYAPYLDVVEVEYWYVRTGETRRVPITREHARETIEWAAVVGTAIHDATAHEDDPSRYPPKPGPGCARCLFVTRCEAGQAALAAVGRELITSEGEARHLAGVWLAGEARQGALQERLEAYLEERDPLALRDNVAVGFHPTMGEYDPQATLRVLADHGDPDPWAALQINRKVLGKRFRRTPVIEQELAPYRVATPPWFGHKKVYRR